MTVQSYTGTSSPYTSSSGGTLQAQIIVTVATSSVAGAFSATKSLINTAAVGSAINGGIDQPNAATASISSIPNGVRGQINVTLNDAYGVALANGPITVTASTGGLVGINATLGSDAATVKNAADVINNDVSFSVSVAQAVANVPANVTVTINYNGTVVATKSFNFQGEVAKVVASKAKIVGTSGATSTTGTVNYTGTNSGNASFVAQYYDAAGTELFPSDTVAGTTAVSGTTNASISAYSVAFIGSAANGPALGSATGGATAGCATLQLQYVNATSGTIIKSNTWSQCSAGDADTYTA
jgi:hypothetical protein